MYKIPEHQFEPDNLAVLCIQVVKLAIFLGDEVCDRPEFTEFVQHDKVRGMLIIMGAESNLAYEDWLNAYLGVDAPDGRSKEQIIKEVNEFRKKYIIKE